jgi:phosphatidylglycerol:prolipoprotein diacylglycerol transferase
MPPINPTFNIGPLVVHWYGVLIVFGAIAGTYMASIEAKRRGEDPEMVWNGLVWCLIGGILGARLYHVLSSPQGTNVSLEYYFVTNPFETVRVLGLSIPFPTALMIWKGGLGIFGGIAGGVLAFSIFAWRNHLTPLTRWLDIGAPGLILAQAIGRWGNFINQELYGPPTSLPWGVRIDVQHRIPPFTDLARFPLETTRFHPVFLYESLWNLGVFIVLMVVGRRFDSRLRDGDIFSLYLIGYGLGRILVETLRPDAWLVGSIPTAQIVSAGLILLAVGLMVWHRRGAVTTGGEEGDEVESQESAAQE